MKSNKQLFNEKLGKEFTEQIIPQRKKIDYGSLCNLDDNWEFIVGWAMGRGFDLKQAQNFAYYALDNLLIVSSRQAKV